MMYYKVTICGREMWIDAKMSLRVSVNPPAWVETVKPGKYRVWVMEGRKHGILG